MHERTPTVRQVVGCAAVMLVVLAGCGGGSGGTTTPEPSATVPTTAPTTRPDAPADPCGAPPAAVGGPGGQRVFVEDADDATALAWSPDGRLFFAERAGRIKVVSGEGVTTLLEVPTVTTEPGGGYSERGLLGLAISPSFATDRSVYAFVSDPDYTTQRVLRFRECAGVAGPPETLVTLPAGSTCCHKGGRLAFGPDGALYVTLGDQHAVPRGTAGAPDSVPQDPADPRGKVLRFRPDGTVPDDNPFGPANPVWATGFRNPFGLAFGPPGAFVTDNGPTGDAGTSGAGHDLALLVERGSRHQWPACHGYGRLTPGATSCLGRPDPDWSSEADTVVPTGATWVDGSGPAGLANHFVFCTYARGMLVFLPGRPRASVRAGPAECRLDVVQGPDGALYFSDRRAIYRLGP